MWPSPRWHSQTFTFMILKQTLLLSPASCLILKPKNTVRKNGGMDFSSLPLSHYSGFSTTGQVSQGWQLTVKRGGKKDRIMCAAGISEQSKLLLRATLEGSISSYTKNITCGPRGAQNAFEHKKHHLNCSCAANGDRLYRTKKSVLLPESFLCFDTNLHDSEVKSAFVPAILSSIPILIIIPYP